MFFMFLLVLLVLLGGRHIVCAQSVHLSLNETHLADRSNILITDIGEGDDALLCVTDLLSCCNDATGNRIGEWIYPNGTTVPIAKHKHEFYRNRGQSVVRLNRRNGNLSSPPGLYCCVVPDATNQIRRVCVNLTTHITIAPENFTAIPTNSREIRFSWSSLAAIEADPSSMTFNYTLTCRPYIQGVTSVTMTYSEAGNHTLQGFSPSGKYNCSVFASSSVGSGPSASINVTTLDEYLFQLWLTGVDICSQWMNEDKDQKLEDITATVLENTQKLCQCGFLNDRITDAVFRCVPGSPQVVTYRAKIHGTTSANSTQLIPHIKQWTTKGTNVIIQQMLLRVDGTCTMAVTSLEVKECPLNNPNSPIANKSNDNSFAFIGGALAIGIIAGVSITSFIAVILCYVLRHRAHKKSVPTYLGKRVEATSPMFGSGAGEMSFHDLRTHESSDSMDHEYADLQEISNNQREHNAPHPSDGQSKTGGYELTQCLAYGAVSQK